MLFAKVVTLLQGPIYLDMNEACYGTLLVVTTCSQVHRKYDWLNSIDAQSTTIPDDFPKSLASNLSGVHWHVIGRGWHLALGEVCGGAWEESLQRTFPDTLGGARASIKE